jgi:hypothetical protein
MCNSNSDNKAKSESPICTEKEKIEKIVQTSIDLPELQQYYKAQEVIGQTELVILKASNIPHGITLLKFKKPVKILDRNQLSDSGIKSYIEFKEINIIRDTAKVLFRYEIQGIYVHVTLKGENCYWKIIDSAIEETKD